MIGLPKSEIMYSSSLSSSDDDDTTTNYTDVVGVKYFKATKEHPPIRLYYPAAESASSLEESNIRNRNNSIRWFEDTGCLPFLKGYAYLAMGRNHKPTLFRCIVVPFLYIFSWFLPIRYLRIPNAYKNIPPLQQQFKSKNKKKRPIILFSHGLTGTGEENKVLCREWAKAGYVVVSVHHTDGSSCYVTLHDESELYYEFGPSLSNYDPSFRPKQLHKRSQELIQAYQFIMSSSSSNSSSSVTAVGDDKSSKDDNNDDEKEYDVASDDDDMLFLRQLGIDKTSSVIAAGFSYGAATAALACTQNKSLFQGAIFLDGWFHVDVTESAGIAFKMPSEAFGGSSEDNDGFPSHIPTLFINSEQFANYTDLFAATKELAGRYDQRRGERGEEQDDDGKDNNSSTNVHVIPGTGHQNFCDVVFWFHYKITRKLMMGAIGPTDPIHAYKEVIRLSIDFLKERIVEQ